ncbi:hypothetical protein PINS_up010146 [Pythium insidiosum]|nr:hypothetical protein PINS_up010146 [Pythium insidiosum]
MQQLLSGLRREGANVGANARRDAQTLLFDAVIGHQLVDATLEEECQRCEREAQAAYQDVVRSLRSSTSSCTSASSSTQAIVDEIIGPEGCPDELLRLEIHDDFQRLSTELADDLAAYEREFLLLVAQDDAAGSLEAARSATGGWSPVDDERFLVVLKAFGSRPPTVLYGQLAAVLPHVDDAALRRHVKFHQHRRFLLEKTRDRQRDHERRLERLKASASDRVAARRQLVAERARQLEQLERMKAECAQRHERVAELRGAREAELRIRQQQRELEALVANEQREAEEQKWRQRHELQRRLVDEYRHDKLLDALADARREEQQREREEQERAAQSVVNAERVQFRQSELEVRPADCLCVYAVDALSECLTVGIDGRSANASKSDWSTRESWRRKRSGRRDSRASSRRRRTSTASLPSWYVCL